MTTRDDVGGLPGAEVYDAAGERVGPVGQVFVEPRTGEPQWVTVRTGSMDFQESFVPLWGAELAGGRLTVAVPLDRIKQAPLLDTSVPLSDADADRLVSHYGSGPAHAAGSTGAAGSVGSAGSAGDDAMTRSEERLVAGTLRVPVERVRLVKYLVTEERQITVPVTREEVRLERVPVGEDEPEREDVTAPDMVLYAEQVVVRTERVPVERVRLRKETVRGEETVTGSVRKERIEYDGPPDARVNRLGGVRSDTSGPA